MVGGALAAGALTVGTMAAGAGTASAAPTYIGPLYYEVVPGIFPPCPDVAAAERAKGTTILVDCVRWFGPQSGPFTPYQLIAGIAPLDGS